MCDLGITAIVMTGLSIAATVAGSVTAGVGQAKAAQSQANYQAQVQAQRNAQIAQNNALATQSLNNQAAQENLRQQQEQAQASQEIQKNDILRMQAQAKLRTSSGESGVSGLSIDGLLADYDRQQSTFVDSVMYNREMSQIRSRSDLEMMRAQAEGRVQSLQPYIPDPVNGPNFAALGLGAISSASGSVAGLANSFNSMKKPTGS